MVIFPGEKLHAEQTHKIIGEILRTIYESRETHLNLFHSGDCLTEYQDGADMLNLALCLSSVSAPGMYLTNPYQTGVCISPTKILHQAASPSAVYVSHQAEYCTKH